MAFILHCSIHIMCDCLELFSFCSFAILDVKIFELCDKGVKFYFFLKIFDRIGFQWDGDVFFYRLKPLAQNNPLGRTQASGNGTKEMFLYKRQKHPSWLVFCGVALRC